MLNKQTAMQNAMIDMASYNGSESAQVEALEKEVFGDELKTSPKAPVDIQKLIDGDKDQKGLAENLIGQFSKLMFPSAQAMGGPAPRQNQMMDRASELTRKNLKSKAGAMPVEPGEKKEQGPELPEIYNKLTPEDRKLFDGYVDRTGINPSDNPADYESALNEQSIYNDLMLSNEQVIAEAIKRGDQPPSEEYLQKLELIRKNDEGNFDEMAAELNKWTFGQPSVFDKGDPYGE